MSAQSQSQSQALVSVAIPRPVHGLFTYRVPEELLPRVRVGGWVKVPFGRATVTAFVVDEPKVSGELPAGLDPKALKDVLEVGDPEHVIPSDVLALCRWAHEYYCAPLGEVLHGAAPLAAFGLKNAKREAREFRWEPPPRADAKILTEDQRAALETLEAARVGKRVSLLHGVTGSGKTEIYIELARRTLAEGRGVLLLVPEIALTSQLHRRLEQGLEAPIALWHSALPDGQRRDMGAALRNRQIRAVVGARSAVFAPVPDLGLIIIDEEHDPTYKQEDRFRYHARDLAVVRARQGGAAVVLGSATPSLETRERVREGKYVVARLDRRIAAGGMPTVEIVNLCEAIPVEGVQAPLAQQTLDAIKSTIAAGEQVIVFLNRRGFASFLICQDCGEVKNCPNCSISLTLHRKRRELKCHVCGHFEPIPDFCQKCQGIDLQPVGAGTESLEEELPGKVEGMRALRLDRDVVTSATRLDKILDDFRAGGANALLGTQMLVKGHDFPGVTLVVVVLADGLFRWPDFRAPERALQVLKQVAGRAGRGDKPGKVLIQTFDPDHAVLQVLTGAASEEAFLEQERELRQALTYPPFGRMARIRCESADQSEARDRAHTIARLLKPFEDERKIDLLGPSEAFLERAKGIYRWDLLIKSPEIQGLQRALFAAREKCLGERWPFLADVDPYGT